MEGIKNRCFSHKVERRGPPFSFFFVFSSKIEKTGQPIIKSLQTKTAAPIRIPATKAES